MLRKCLAPAVAGLLCVTALGGLQAQERLTIKIAATTDVHGRLRGWDYAAGGPDSLRGLARAASIVDSLRRVARDRVVLVDAGDLLQGNAMTYVAGRVDSMRPHPVIAAMNVMRYDAAAVGNHEFNYGVPLFDRAIAQAGFPFLAANTRRLDGKREYPARLTVTRGGAKIAIIGVTTPGSMIWDRDNLRGRVEVTDIVAALPAEVRAARAEGADVVVVVAHSGLGEVSSYDTVGTAVASENPMARVAREVPGIDLLVIGHSHRELADSTINGVMVMQPRNWATSVAVATLELERAPGGAWRVASKSGVTVPVRGWPEQQAVVRAVERAHRAAMAYSTAVVARTDATWQGDSARLRDTPLIDLIHHVQRQETGAELSIASAFSLEAGFAPGPISVERLTVLYPYENTLRALRLSGAQIRAFLEHSARYWTVGGDADGLRIRPDPRIPGYNYDILQGLDYTIDLAQPIGHRVTQLERHGQPVADSDSFTVAINSYRASGGGGYDMLRGAPVVYEGSREIRELIIEFLKNRGSIQPSDVYEENYRLLPPRPTLRLIAMNDMHGAFRPRPDGANGNRGGYAQIATMVRGARAECAPACATLLLSGGDLFTGTPASDLTTGAATLPVYNAMGFSAHALGNHEFDYGQDTLRARMRGLDAAILGANVTYADGSDVPWIRDDTLVTTAAGRVGIIGIADPATPRTTMPRHVADLRFAPPAPVITARAAALRERGAQWVVVVAHLGGFCTINAPDECRGEIIELARTLAPGTVDAIVSGHTHSEVATIVNGIPIVQARSSTRALGIVDLGPTPGSPPQRPVVRDVVSDSIVPDPTIERIVAEAVERVAPRVGEIIATATERFPRDGNQYALGNLIADAQRAAGNGDVGVMNNGGIRAEIRQGTVTYGDLHEVSPFANRLVAITVRGAELRRYFERLVGGRSISVHISGATLRYDPAAPSGSRLRQITMADGRRLNDRLTYRVIMSDFMASGGDGAGLGAGSAPEEIGVIDLDALIAQLRKLPNGTLSATPALTAPRIQGGDAVSEALRVFVNGKGVSVSPGSSVLDAVAASDAAAADEVRAGTRAIVDSRGLPVAVDTSVHGGYVMRVVSARALRDTEA